jgi:tetratricopeptide (TPR) repeat protein
MKRWSMVLVAIMLLAPTTAQAQKRPSNNMHTRSADVYLGQAEKTRVIAERAEILEKALAAASEGIRQDAGNPKPWFQAGLAYYGIEDFVGADSMFDRAQQIYPDYGAEIQPLRLNGWITLYNRGVEALQFGNIPAAIQALELADRLYDERPEALVTLGSLYVESGEFAKAEQTYGKALRILTGPGRRDLKPNELQAWAEDQVGVSMRLANMLLEQDRTADAQKVYTDLLAVDPDNLIARTNLAVLLARSGDVESASAMYRELLRRDDLGESSLFNIGVGLFRAEQYSASADAFRRAIGINPQAHEALYNLSQALLALSGVAQKDLEAADAARKPQLNAELGRLSEELLATAQRLHDLDPANRNVLMLQAQAQRTLGELANPAAREEWNRKVLATLELHKALPFEVADVIVTPGSDEIQVSGRVVNLTTAQGSPMRFRFVVIDEKGAELASEDVTVTAPATTESARFNFTLAVPEGAAGWKYRLQP